MSLFRRVLTASVVGAMLTLLLVPAAANAAALTAATWVASSTSPNDTAVRYTWTLKTASAGSISTVTFTVPAGTAGASLTVGNALGIGAASSVVLSSGTVTYTVASAYSVPANTSILISIDGFTNTSTPGSYTSTVATSVDTGLATSALVFNDNTATATFTVQQSVSFSASASSVSLGLNPSVTNDQTSGATTLTIRTNADGGYILQAAATPMSSPGGATLTPVSAGVASPVNSGSFPVNRWGYSASSSSSGAGAPVNGTLTLSGGLTSSSNYVGFTSSPETIATQTGPTNGDSLSFLTRAKIDISQPAGSYVSQVRYTVAPTY